MNPKHLKIKKIIAMPARTHVYAVGHVNLQGQWISESYYSDEKTAQQRIEHLVEHSAKKECTDNV